MKTIISSFLLVFGVLSATAQSEHEHDCAYTKSHFAESRMQASQRISAARGGDQYDIHFYDITLEVSNTATTVQGNVFIEGTVISAGMDTFWFELKDNMTIDSVYVNGIKRTNFIRQNNVVLVPLPSSIPQLETVNTRIWYGGTAQQAGFFSGLSTAFSNTWGVNVSWTLSEPFSAPDWLPCKQDLWDKIDSVNFNGIATIPNKVGSLGLLTNIVPLAGNKTRYEWKTRYPTAFYLIAFAVTNYAEYLSYAKPSQLAGDSILIQHWVYNANNSSNVSAVNFFKPQLDATNDMMDVFSDLFGLYPFWQEKYGHMQSAMGGGMEHQTMSTMGGFGQDLTAHELIHQWFGNYITCATWSDIWLNEGFASYGEYLYRQYGVSQASADSWMTSAHNSARQPTGSVYVPAGSSVNRIFNGSLTYKKGGSVVHMLRWEMENDSAFFRGIGDYLSAKANDVSTTDELRQILETSSGLTLQPFFEDWVYGEGFPTYSVRWNQIDSTVFVEVNQTTSSPVTPLFRNKVPVRLIIGGTTQTLRVDPAQGINRFQVAGTVTTAQLDPTNILLKGTTSNIIKQNSLGVHVADLAQINFKLYPNPAADFVVIETELDQFELRITDLQGRELQRLQNNSGKMTLTTAHLQAGMYLLQLQDAQGNLSKIERLVVR
ncbi:MAG: M1 family aminopeptidase [Sphingobacteriaceae bacterium]|nr:M1 family aminopeptidase [Sphingobacteriaceae bacterium]